MSNRTHYLQCRKIRLLLLSFQSHHVNLWRDTTVIIRRTLCTATILLCTLNAAFADDAQSIQPIRARIQLMRAANAHTPTEAVTQFYEQRDFAPVWTDAARLDQLIKAVEDIANDGLNPEDYHLSQLK